MARLVANLRVTLSSFGLPKIARRGYAAAASTADPTRGINERGSEEKGYYNSAENRRSAQNKSWWMPHPVTGHFVPENHHGPEPHRDVFQLRDNLFANQAGSDREAAN